MATPTTLVEFWTSEVLLLEDASAPPPAPPTGMLPDARAALAAAVLAETSANTAFTSSGTALTAMRDAVDAARKKLAAIAMPADGDPLLIAMSIALVAWREAAAIHVASDADLRDKRAKRKSWSDRVAALTAQLADAKTALDLQSALTKQTDAWIVVAGAPPLKDVKKDADTALAGADRTAAEANVKSDFPSSATLDKSFFDQARARRGLAAQLAASADAMAAAAMTANADWAESTKRESAKTEALQRAYDDAVEALRALMRSRERLDAASGVFKQIAGRAASPLSKAQRAELITAVAATKTARENALQKLTKRDVAQAALFKAHTDYATALFAAQAKDPDQTIAALVAADPALKTLQDDLATKPGTAQTAFDDAKSKLTADDLGVLGTWFAAAPDPIWDELDALDTAIGQLTELSKNAPTDVVKALKNSEKALAANLDAVRAERRKSEWLRDGLAKQQTWQADEHELKPRRQLAATRFIDEV